MPGVIVRDKETFEKALKRFKKACEKAGVISDMKRHQHFEKPSERKKRKINAAKRKRIKFEKMFGEWGREMLRTSMAVVLSRFDYRLRFDKYLSCNNDL